MIVKNIYDEKQFKREDNMTKLKSAKCDECGEIKELKGTETAFKWYRLEHIGLYFRTKDDSENIPDQHKLVISAETDFCSRQCLDAWMKKAIDKVTRGR